MKIKPLARMFLSTKGKVEKGIKSTIFDCSGWGDGGVYLAIILSSKISNIFKESQQRLI